MPIDYSALTQPVTKADIATFKAARAQQHGKAAQTALFTIIGFIILGFVGIFTVTMLLTTLGKASAPAVLAIVGLFTLMVIFAVHKQLEKRARLYKFAAANSIQFLYDTANPSYAGMIFDKGDSRKIQDALRFSDGTEIGNYQYSTGSGKNRHTHVWGYVRIKLTRHLPNMVLDARKNNLFGSLTNLPDSFNRNQTLSLEGDFNNYFTLYAPQEYERDALYIFTPDVMAAVIDAGQAFDMEVIDDSLMLYSSSRFTISSATQLRTLLGIIEKIGTELRDQSDYYADERVGDRAADIIAEPGRRLKSGVSFGAIACFVLVIFYFIFMTLR